MIHIVFNEADIEVLSKSFVLDESLNGQILQVKDEYAVGPILDIFLSTGIVNRKNWWKEVLAGGDYAGMIDSQDVDDQKMITDLKTKLSTDSSEVIWIWAAQNKHDVCGYYWLVSQLKEFHPRVFILYLNNLPFINDKGHIFYTSWLHTITPGEFSNA